MSDYRGSSQGYSQFNQILTKYIKDMRTSLAMAKKSAKVSRDNIPDSAISGGLNHCLDDYSKIESDLLQLEGASKKIGEMILRYQKAEQYGRNIGNGGRHR